MGDGRGAITGSKGSRKPLLVELKGAAAAAATLEAVVEMVSAADAMVDATAPLAFSPVDSTVS